MNIYRVALVGHRRIYSPQDIEKKLEEIITDLISKKEYVEFYIGRNGDFDILAASVIKRIQKKLDSSNSALILVLPYPIKDLKYYQNYYDDIIFPLDAQTHFKAAITKRNHWLIDNCHALIPFVQHEHGGAYDALRYAKFKGMEIII